jgi:membrane protein DedA with SNARE-associated domain
VTAPLIAMVVLAYTGEALFPALVDGRPVELILLAPSVRNFGLVTNQLDALTYYGIGIPRVLLTDPLYYLLGFWFGDSAIKWMERRTRTWGEQLRQLEQGFEKYGYLILLALPYNFTPMLAGAARMPLYRVLLVRAAGLTVRLFLIRRAGEALESPLSSLTEWIGTYRFPLLGVFAGVVVLSIAREMRSGETKVSSLAHFEEEIEEIEGTEKIDGEEPRDPLR